MRFRVGGVEFRVYSPGLNVQGIQGYLAHKKMLPPEDHHRALGIVLP